MVAEHTRQQTLGNVSDAIFSVDRAGRVLSMNAATRAAPCERGADPAGSIGRRVIEDCFPDLAGSREAALLRAATTNRTEARFEIQVNRWNRWFNVGLFPEGDGGLSIHVTDITDLRKTEARLRAAIEGASLIAFEWDLRTGEVVRLSDSATGDMGRPVHPGAGLLDRASGRSRAGARAARCSAGRGRAVFSRRIPEQRQPEGGVVLAARPRARDPGCRTERRS